MFNEYRNKHTVVPRGSPRRQSEITAPLLCIHMPYMCMCVIATKRRGVILFGPVGVGTIPRVESTIRVSW